AATLPEAQLASVLPQSAEAIADSQKSSRASRAAVLVPIILFIVLFGVLLASFPARNADVWKHLADGRDLIHRATFSPTWLYDLGPYARLSGDGVDALCA